MPAAGQVAAKAAPDARGRPLTIKPAELMKR